MIAQQLSLEDLFRDRRPVAISMSQAVTEILYPWAFEKFWARVEEAPTGCWEYTGHRDSKGYGKACFKLNGREHSRAHRVAYEMLVGPIPAGLQLDHLCRNRCCVNPSHLEPVTGRENSFRGQAPGVVLHLEHRCMKGHPLTAERLPNGRHAPCRICAHERMERFKARKKAGQSAPDRAATTRKSFERFRRERAS